jgi:hypothetical protein
MTITLPSSPLPQRSLLFQKKGRCRKGSKAFFSFINRFLSLLTVLNIDRFYCKKYNLKMLKNNKLRFLRRFERYGTLCNRVLF